MKFKFKNTTIQELNKILTVANRCDSEIYITNEDETDKVSARSTLGVLSFADRYKDIVVIVDNPNDDNKFIRVFDEL